MLESGILSLIPGGQAPIISILYRLMKIYTKFRVTRRTGFACTVQESLLGDLVTLTKIYELNKIKLFKTYNQ